MKNQTLLQLALGVGLGCAMLLLVLWRRDATANNLAARATPAKSAPVATAASETATPAPSALSAEAQRLLESLQQLLTKSDARAREALLTFKDEAAMRRFLERAQKAGLTVIGRLDALRSVRVRYGSFAGLQDDLLQNASDYASAGANDLIGIPMPPEKQDRAAQNQVPFGNDTLAFVGANGDRSAWGRGVTIAILDTGVSADATFGNGRLNVLDIGLGTTPGTGKSDGHGTAVAALAAGGTNDAAGVAPSANLLSIRVTDDRGVSDLFTVSQGIVAAVNAGAKVINVSLGGYSTGSVLDAAIAYATSQGAIIVAAAGNDQAAQLAWPAADSRVVSVGAVDKAEQQVSFSNSGPQLQLSAPGYGVQTAWLNNQRVYVDGTSASAPIVSGAIAAVLSQNPSLTPQQAAELLDRTANDAGAPGTDPAFGHGIVNLATALNSSNLNYVDTAVSSHYYDTANNQMDFVVQNRSGRAISGMTLNVTVGTTTTSQTVPSLAAGETYVAKLPVNDTALKTNGSLTFITQLTNPLGVNDQVPANNRRSSVLTAPTSP
jgi:hypothetical protein